MKITKTKQEVTMENKPKSRQRFFWMLAGSALVICVIIYLAFLFPWPSESKLTGTIGGVERAAKYHTTQMSEEDVVLTDVELQSVLQSDVIQNLLNNKEFMEAMAKPEIRNALSNPEILKAFSVPGLAIALESPEMRAVMSVPEIRKVFASPELQQAFQSPEVRKAFTNPEMQEALTPKPWHHRKRGRFLNILK
jgi:hypothetical protein